MPAIKSRKHVTLRGTTRAALYAGLALVSLLPVQAQTAPGPSADERRHRPKKLQTVEVTGQALPGAVSPKFTQPLQDTPQTVQVIDSALFHQQGATTLTEALRNSAGVGTFYAGENGSTSTGDAVYMRGFDTSSSLFVDGVRDLGTISRDVFNIEQVEVVKGPAGTDNGRSAPTGAINLVSKQAGLDNALSGSLTAGSADQKRATLDWNQRLSGNGALRLNLMWQDSGVPGRDHVRNARRGIASSLGFGLDGATRVWLDLLYVKQDNVPDGYVPTIGLPGWQPQPGLEALIGHPVESTNFYGTRLDHDDVTAQMATVRIEHDVNDNLRLHNITRWGRTRQDYLLTSFMLRSGNLLWTDPADLSSYTLARNLPTFKDIDNTILTNQFNLQADFTTGSVRHNLSAGLELTREQQDSRGVGHTGSLPPANLYDPDWNQLGTLTWAHDGSGSFGRTDTGSLYLFDTLKFGERFLITAGLRVDRYDTRYDSSAVCNTPGTGSNSRSITYCGTAPLGSVVPTADLQTDGTLFNWKLGAVYKPRDTLSLYLNAAQSQQPPGGANFQLSTSSNNANNPALDPQKARTFEVGAKWSLRDDRLAINAALFRTDVSNEINIQVLDDNGNPTQTGRKRVQGIELSMTGQLTEAWSVSAGYSHLDTDVTEGAPVSADGTPNLSYTPGDAFTAWTSYTLPSGLTLGGGARYIGGLHRGLDGAVGTPATTASYTVFDAVLSYPLGHDTTLRLNAYNLGNRHYVAAINKSGYRYLPGITRSFTLSLDVRF